MNPLYIIPTPIGNLEDITVRSLNILKNSDLVLCEDTRRTSKLLNHYSIKKKLISFHKDNELMMIDKILDLLWGEKEKYFCLISFLNIESFGISIL